MQVRFRAVFFLGIMMLFASCKNPFYKDIERDEAIQIPAGFCMLTAQADGLSGRAALPSLGTNTAYWAVIRAPDGKYLTGTPSAPLSTTPTLLSNKGSGSNLQFLFVSSAQSGDYTIAVYVFDSGFTPAPSDTGANYKAKSVTVHNLGAYTQNIDLGSLVLAGNTGRGARVGRVDLPLNIDSSSGIQRIELIVKRRLDDGSGEEDISSSGVLRAVLSGFPKKITHTGTGISPGIYTLTIKAYDASSGGNQIFLENPVQTITVFSGCKTNTWYGIDGNPLPAGTGALTIQQIAPSASNTFFVKGTGGSLPNTVNANDGNSGISIAAPLASLNAALAKCTAAGPYTIYVDGEITEPNPAAEREINKAVTIKSLSTRAAVKKAAGFDKSLIKIASGGSLTLDNIVLDGADIDYAGDGGLVYNEGTLTLKNGTVLQNGKAQNGGAVYNKGTFNIGDSALIRLSTGNDENKPGKKRHLSCIGQTYYPNNRSRSARRYNRTDNRT